MIPSSAIEVAAFSRAQEFRDQAADLTLKSVRRILERDLGLESRELDSQKDVVRDIIDKILVPQDAPEALEEKPLPKKGSKKSPDNARGKKSNVECDPSNPKPQKRQRVEKETADSDEEGSLVSNEVDNNGACESEEQESEGGELEHEQEQEQEQEDDEEGLEEEGEGGSSGSSESSGLHETHGKVSKKPRKGGKAGGDSEKEVWESDEDTRKRTKKQERSKEDDRTARPEKVAPAIVEKDPKVERLKRVFQAMGKRIPPQAYVKARQAPEGTYNIALARELKSLLEREGLSGNPTKEEIEAVKRRRAREQDLEGIDSGNIVSGARRTRGSTQHAWATSRSESDEEGSEEEGETEDETEDEVEADEDVEE